MSKILVSGLFIHPGKVGGAENYFYNLLKGFYAIGKQDNVVILLNEAYQESLDPVIHHFDCRWVSMKSNRVLYDSFLPYFVKDWRSFEVVFQPNYTTHYFYHQRGQKRVTTIHDLQYLHLPHLFSKLKRQWQYQAHLHTLKKSDEVICISDFVRQDIIERFGEQYAPKLRTIYNPIDFSRFEGEPKPDLLPERPYILSVSALFPHKNTLTLLRAFQLFKQKSNSDLSLVLVGQKPSALRGFTKADYVTALEKVLDNTPDVQITGYLDNASLGSLYEHCAFFVFPSLFEGFGMPPIEALGFGKPVITTRGGSLAEVTENQAIYLETPSSAEELSNQMQNVANALPEFQRKYADFAIHFREKYALESIAEKYWESFSTGL